MKKIVLTALLLVSPVAAQAQWSALPGGNIGYAISYSTSARFECDPRGAGITSGDCAAYGNTMRLTSDGGILDLFFEALANQTVTVTTGLPTPQRIPIGVLKTAFGGTGPFLFPMSLRGTQPLFSLTTHMVIDPGGNGSVTAGYISHGEETVHHNCCETFNNYFELPVTPPPGIGYTNIIFHDFTNPVIFAVDDATDISASVVLSPEPASLWLFATGTVIGALVLGRRRKAA